MQEHYPSSSHEATEPSSVSLTEQEWQTLHMSADPLQDPEVAVIMADKHISFDGSPLEVTVTATEEGESARQFIMTTDSDDPFTRHKELSRQMSERDTPSATDKLEKVVETFGDEESLEDVLDEASESHKEQVSRLIETFNERLPRLINKNKQEDESIANFQKRINDRLGVMANALATSRQVTAGELENIVSEIHSIGKAMDGQSEGLKSKRGVADAIRRGASELKVGVSRNTEEYRTVVNHLTEQMPDTTVRDERQAEASRTRDDALKDVIALEQDVNVLDTQLRVVGGIADQRRTELRSVQNILTLLHDTVRRTGRYDPNELRRAKLKMQTVQEGHGVIGQKLRALPTLEAA